MPYPPICFHGSCFGSTEHLLVNYQTKQTTWVTDDKLDKLSYVLWVGQEELKTPGASAEEFLQLHGITSMPSFPPKRLIREFEAVSPTVLTSTMIPWRLCLSNLEFHDALRTYLKTTKEKLIPLWDSSPQTEYYRNVYPKTTEALLHFQPAKINETYYRHVLETDAENVTSVFESFEPNKQGFASSAPAYSKSHSKTGRLKVTNGPKILLLDKKHRECIFESRFGSDGIIIQLDYKSLEPRVLLAHAKKFFHASLPDIYSGISTNKAIPRELLKNLTLTKLYGGGREKIQNLFGDVPFDEKIIKLIEDHFSFNEVTQSLKNQVDESGHLQNEYGKLIDIQGVEPWLYLNYWTQSTAVDVALLGFRNIIRYILDHGLQTKIVPLFVLHDALILDIHKDHIAKIQWLKIAGSTNIKNFESVTFYLEDTEINNDSTTGTAYQN